MMKWFVAATVAVSVLAVPSANAQQRAEVDFSTCMKTTKATSVTTSKGSKDVRKELNKLALEIICRWNVLSSVVKSEAARKNNAVTSAEAAFTKCVKRLGISKDRWYKRYDMFAGSGPCVKEAFDAFSARTNSGYGLIEWDAHNAWLNSLVMFGNLAKIYPDSVQPRILADYIQRGKTATSCLSRKQWCAQL